MDDARVRPFRVGEDAPDLGVVRLHHDDGAREQHVDDRGVSHQVPVGLRAVLQLHDGPARIHLPKVRTERLEQADVREEQGMDGVRVQHPEVVRLEERVDHHLPVHAPHERAPRVVQVAVEPVGGELRPEPGEEAVQVERGRRGESGPDHAAELQRRQLDEVSFRQIDPVEAPAIGHPREAPPAVVGPAVVGTDELPAVPVAGRHPRPAMAAHVQERAHAPVVAAREQHRNPRLVVRRVAARRGQPGGEPEELGGAADHRPLALEPVRVGIDVDAVAHHAVRHRRGPGVEVAQQLPDEGDLGGVLHPESPAVGLPSVHCSTGSRNTQSRRARVRFTPPASRPGSPPPPPRCESTPPRRDRAASPVRRPRGGARGDRPAWCG